MSKRARTPAKPPAVAWDPFRLAIERRFALAALCLASLFAAASGPALAEESEPVITVPAGMLGVPAHFEMEPVEPAAPASLTAGRSGEAALADAPGALFAGLGQPAQAPGARADTLRLYPAPAATLQEPPAEAPAGLYRWFSRHFKLGLRYSSEPFEDGIAEGREDDHAVFISFVGHL